MNTFKLQVLRINEIVFDGPAVSVTAPGSVGEMTILPKHETMLTSLRAGTLCIRTTSDPSRYIDINRGFLEATKDKITILL